MSLVRCKNPRRGKLYQMHLNDMLQRELLEWIDVQADNQDLNAVCLARDRRKARKLAKHFEAIVQKLIEQASREKHVQIR